ncbi:MAG: isochorismatase family protein [Bernardetiaceae bacterium]|nr:isochorismatase family protein [Bernardetiaceae bacterium]
MSSALLIIDAQNDFCHTEGALYVPGSARDTKRLSDFIMVNISKISHICVTLDWHKVHDISHPNFWKDENGNPPAPFTPISFQEVKQGKWIPQFSPEKATNYLQQLEAEGEFTHLIWPPHCIAGTKGASLQADIADAITSWAAHNGKDYSVVTKGNYPLSEHFGVFKAQISTPEVAETMLNQKLIQELNVYDKVYVGGQAKSHCVATSIKQAMEFAPDLAQKMIILEDCMSDVTGLGHLGEPIYEAARKKGLVSHRSTVLRI